MKVSAEKLLFNRGLACVFYYPYSTLQSCQCSANTFPESLQLQLMNGIKTTIGIARIFLHIRNACINNFQCMVPNGISTFLQKHSLERTFFFSFLALSHKKRTYCFVQWHNQEKPTIKGQCDFSPCLMVCHEEGTDLQWRVRKYLWNIYHNPLFNR